MLFRSLLKATSNRHAAYPLVFAALEDAEHLADVVNQRASAVRRRENRATLTLKRGRVKLDKVGMGWGGGWG